jgi:hypothetical protein
MPMNVRAEECIDAKDGESFDGEEDEQDDGRRRCQSSVGLDRVTAPSAERFPDHGSL